MGASLAEQNFEWAKFKHFHCLIHDYWVYLQTVDE
jgi:hypothetical protein